jgi:hypothetical protein
MRRRHDLKMVLGQILLQQPVQLQIVVYNQNGFGHG